MRIFFLLCSLAIFKIGIAEEVELDFYTVPEGDDLAIPNYPNRALLNDEEGWVRVNFMVDELGNTFEPVIISSTGNERFHGPALKALKESKFKPALLNGEPIIGSSVHQYTFRLEGATGATRSFVNKYKKFSEVISQGSKQELELLVEDLLAKKNKNLYEYAYSNWARYLFAKRFSSSLSQLEYLELALDSDNIEDYLSSSTVNYGRSDRFKLEVAANRLAEAVNTYQWILYSGDTKTAELYEKAYEKILEYKDNDKSYGMDVSLSDSGLSFLKLHKSKFYLDNIIGNVDELKLRCSQKYIAWVFDPELNYTIPESWGDCNLEVVGGSNTSFLLVQYK